MELNISEIIKDNYMQGWLQKIRNRVVYLYGAGSFGKETYYFLKKNGIDIRGFLDKRADEIKEYCGKPVYSLNSINVENKKNVLVLFSIVMDKDERRNLMKQIAQSGFLHIEEAQFYRSIQIIPDDLAEKNLREYYLEKASRIREAYLLLEDEKSSAIYNANLKAHFLRDYSDCLKWEDSMKEQYFPEDIRLSKGYSRFVDCGGFTGDTIEDLLRQKKNVQAIASFEPDIHNFRHLSDACRKKDTKIVCFPCAVADKTEFQKFSAARGSGSISEYGESTILSICLDDALIGFNPTFIKMDIEGAEIKALYGAKRIICENVPDLAICVYHNVNHLWDVILLLKSWNLGYKFFVRSYNAYTMETVLYASRGEN